MGVYKVLPTVAKAENSGQVADMSIYPVGSGIPDQNIMIGRSKTDIPRSAEPSS